MRRRGKAIRRVVRGELPRPGRYWTAFLVLSFITHSLMLAVLSGAAESFIESLARPEPPRQEVMYVGLVFQKPVPVAEPAMPYTVRHEEARPARKTPAPKPLKPKPAAKAKPPVKEETSEPKRKAAPEAPADKTVQELPRLAPPKILQPPVPTAPEEDTGISVLPAKKPSPNTITVKVAAKPAPELVRPDTSEADRKYVAFFEQNEGAVTVIKGTESTMVAKSELKEPPPPEATPEKPVIEPLPEAERPANTDSPMPETKQLEEPPAPEPEEESEADVEEPQAVMAPSVFSVITGALPIESPRRAVGATQPGVFAMFWDLMESHEPERVAQKMPEHGAVMMQYSGHDPENILKPSAVAEQTPELPAPVRLARQELPVAAPRMPPKIIEVADNPIISAKPPELTITEPAPGDIDRSLVIVRGEAAGEGITSVLLGVGGTKKELLVSGGAFSSEVVLEEGRNVLTAACIDTYGRTARTRLVVNYVPPDEGAIISFITPKDNGIIDALARKELDISGTVKGGGADMVRVFLNKSIRDVPVVDGSFRFTALLQAEENTLYAEALGRDGKTSRSPDIRFRVVNLFPKDLTVLMKTSGAGGVTMTHSWRAHPLSARSAVSAAPGFADSATTEGLVTEVESAVPGIFTVGASYDLRAGETTNVTFVVTLYGYDPARKKTRTFGPFTLSGRGKLPAVRLLMPERVFWEDDYWFSGTIESSSGTTKFREPEGISWREEQ